MSAEVWNQVYRRLADLIREHRTTLIFVNTRRLAERVTHHLSGQLGEENVAAHHGSLAKDQRLNAEQRLKHGKLKALVATASLELGIDIGDVDLVCQLGSPRSIASFLQRVGRSGHAVDGTPKGRLFPLSRDELVECAALLDSVRRSDLDRIEIPEQPLDVLAQQIVAEVAARECGEDELFALVRRAWPYRRLSREILPRSWRCWPTALANQQESELRLTQLLVELSVPTSRNIDLESILRPLDHSIVKSVLTRVCCERRCHDLSEVLLILPPPELFAVPPIDVTQGPSNKTVCSLLAQFRLQGLH
jgi:Lhr-like helicase